MFKTPKIDFHRLVEAGDLRVFCGLFPFSAVVAQISTQGANFIQPAWKDDSPLWVETSD
jgi:hypothetical protein